MTIGAPVCRPASPGFTPVRGRGPSGSSPGPNPPIPGPGYREHTHVFHGQGRDPGWTGDLPADRGRDVRGP